jgi:hypothetical protein
MDVIGFICVSLGSSTAQLHDSPSSRRAQAYSEAGFSSQNGERAWGVYYHQQRSDVRFLWARGLNAKDIHKEMFPVYGGKCLSRKAVREWVEKRGKCLLMKRMKRRRESGWDNRLLCCRFRRTGNAMEQVYQCWRRIWQEINVFPQVRI